MQPHLPDHLLTQASQLCTTASGPVHVKLILQDDRTIYDVLISQTGEIVRAGGRPVYGGEELGFKPCDIVGMSAY
jgi:hypothetical protein